MGDCVTNPQVITADSSAFITFPILGTYSDLEQAHAYAQGAQTRHPDVGVISQPGLDGSKKFYVVPDLEEAKQALGMSDNEGMENPRDLGAFSVYYALAHPLGGTGRRLFEIYRSEEAAADSAKLMSQGGKTMEVRAGYDHPQGRLLAKFVDGRRANPESGDDPLFIGLFPTGFSYADRTREEQGDYKRIAFLPYDTLELKVYDPKSKLLKRNPDGGNIQKGDWVVWTYRTKEIQRGKIPHGGLRALTGKVTHVGEAGILMRSDGGQPGFPRGKVIGPLPFSEVRLSESVHAPHQKRNPDEVDEVSARELSLFIENDANLYRQREVPITKNLALKKAKGIYDRDKAVKLWMYLVEDGARKYTREYAGPGAKWNEIFPKATRQEVAKDFNKSFETEYDLGNYDQLLPAKYQKKNPGDHAGKMRRCIASVKYRGGVDDPAAVCASSVMGNPNGTDIGNAYEYGYREGEASMQRDEARRQFIHSSYVRWTAAYARGEKRREADDLHRQGYQDAAEGRERSHGNPEGEGVTFFWHQRLPLMATDLAHEDAAGKTWTNGRSRSGSELRIEFNGIVTGDKTRKDKSLFDLFQRQYYETYHRDKDRRYRNPATSAEDLYEQFHGRPAESVIEYAFQEWEPDKTAKLGRLVEIKVETITGKDVTLAAPEEGKDQIELTSNPEGTQLYFDRGDQELDLKKLGFRDAQIKEDMVIGTLYELTYSTRKKFNKFNLVDYFHELGEETGEMPVLMYRPKSKRMGVAGGAYIVKPEGIVN
jgi:hypothetical protein